MVISPVEGLRPDWLAAPYSLLRTGCRRIDTGGQNFQAAEIPELSDGKGRGSA
jgi:hypothetical protein